MYLCLTGESIWNHSAGFLLRAFEADLPEDPKLLPRQATLTTIEEERSAKAIMEETMRASSQAQVCLLPSDIGDRRCLIVVL